MGRHPDGIDRVASTAQDAVESPPGPRDAKPTCRLGVPGDRGAVVDQRLGLSGTQGLRVVDASVMPDFVGGNINAPVMMIANFVLSEASHDPSHAVGSPLPGSRALEAHVG